MCPAQGVLFMGFQMVAKRFLRLCSVRAVSLSKTFIYCLVLVNSGRTGQLRKNWSTQEELVNSGRTGWLRKNGLTQEEQVDSGRTGWLRTNGLTQEERVDSGRTGWLRKNWKSSWHKWNFFGWDKMHQNLLKNKSLKVHIRLYLWYRISIWLCHMKMLIFDEYSAFILMTES